MQKRDIVTARGMNCCRRHRPSGVSFAYRLLSPGDALRVLRCHATSVREGDSWNSSLRIATALASGAVNRDNGAVDKKNKPASAGSELFNRDFV
jgi:hypothetical protein